MRSFMIHRSLLFLIFYFIFSHAVAQSPVKRHGQLQVKGTQLCDQHGQPVTLRGVSYGWHNWWPRFYNKKAVKTLARDWHCTVVRAAMGVEPDGGYLTNRQRAMDCVTQVVEAAIKQNIYVIIDWHAHQLHPKEARAFFSEMAQRYGHYPHVIYELCNEPVEDTWRDLKKYATPIIDEIRKYDPDNLILMGCPHWDQDIHLAADSPLKGYDNLMYTVHFYAATHGETLRQRTEEAIKQGLPVFISECGFMEASGDGPIDSDSQQQWLALCERYGLSWLCWSVSDKAETCSMLLPSAKSTGPWRDDVLSPYGRMVKQLLATYNNTKKSKR